MTIAVRAAWPAAVAMLVSFPGAVALAAEEQAEQFTPEFRQVHTTYDPKHTPKIVAPASVALNCVPRVFSRSAQAAEKRSMFFTVTHETSRSLRITMVSGAVSSMPAAAAVSGRVMSNRSSGCTDSRQFSLRSSTERSPPTRRNSANCVALSRRGK